MGLWFKAEGIDGKADAGAQMLGLDLLWFSVDGKSVLDAGCAEGLIAEKVKRCGAVNVVGIDNRPDAIKVARKRNNAASGIHFDVADVEIYRPEKADVILLLGVLHKLSNPEEVFTRMLNACGELCVLRLPGDCWPVMMDSRSGSRPVDLEFLAAGCGFCLQAIDFGPADSRGNQIVIYLRRSAD